MENIWEYTIYTTVCSNRKLGLYLTYKQLQVLLQASWQPTSTPALLGYIISDVSDA